MQKENNIIKAFVSLHRLVMCAKELTLFNIAGTIITANKKY